MRDFLIKHKWPAAGVAAVVVVVAVALAPGLISSDPHETDAAGVESFIGTSANAATIDDELLLETGTLDDLVLGSEDAPVTIIEYASMTCPHCAAFHKEVLPEIKETYIDTGQVKLIFREFPLDRLAAAASMLARCVEGGRYFPFVDVLFNQQQTWVVEQPLVPLRNLAKQAGLSDEAFDKCLANQELLDGIVWVRDRGEQQFDVQGTPTFFVNGELVRANQFRTFEMAQTIIERHLDG